MCLTLQAGVNLGTALSKHASQKDKRLRKLPPQIRPKRRAPISEVLLVGGATRMPAFQQFVKNMTGLEPNSTNVNPDEVGNMLQAVCTVCRVPSLVLVYVGGQKGFAWCCAVGDAVLVGHGRPHCHAA